MEEEIRTSLGSALGDLVAEDLALMSLDDL